jgi:two-component system CheB/CheR fusion protein
MTNGRSDQDFSALLEYLRESRGFDFTAYKVGTLQRRVRKRMGTVGVGEYSEYLDYLQVHPDEFEPLFNTILINVTSFFRDPEAWDYIAREIIPHLVRLQAADGGEKTLRIWSAGCSSGEEAYTIAMLMVEAIGAEAFRRRVKIYATDVDEEALTEARHGTYTDRQMQQVPARLRNRYFDRNGGNYSFKKDLRRSVIFGRHDLIQDAPISRIDLLISRNTLMYLNSEAQTRVLARFHYALNEGGFLFLGKAETLLSRSDNFKPVELSFRVFSKPNPGGGERLPLLMADSISTEEREARVELQRLQEEGFRSSPVAQIILDTSRSVALVNEVASDLFNLSPADIGRPLAELDLSYQPVELRKPVDDVLSTGSTVYLSDVPFPSSTDARRWFDVQIAPVVDSGGERLGARISFIDMTHSRQLAEQLQQSQADLETANEELQSSNEELETTNEELQSTVEELETTNEELQSTNEELETMNEELHSTNEELEAANEQLMQRSAQLDQSAVFLESVMASMNSAVVVVDPSMTVRAWSRRAEDLWGVRPEEAQGVHFSNLDILLPLDELLQPMRECLTGRSSDYEVTLAATNRRGRSIQCRVTLNPLKDVNGDITGVVILMEEHNHAPTEGQ